jgi:hypothetical protein
MSTAVFTTACDWSLPNHMNPINTHKHISRISSFCIKFTQNFELYKLIMKIRKKWVRSSWPLDTLSVTGQANNTIIKYSWKLWNITDTDISLSSDSPDYWLQTGVRFLARTESFSFTSTSRLVLEYTQSSVKRVLRALSNSVKRAQREAIIEL